MSNPDSYHKKDNRLISLMNIDTFLNNIPPNQIEQHTMTKLDVSLDRKDGLASEN